VERIQAQMGEGWVEIERLEVDTDVSHHVEHLTLADVRCF